MAKQISPFASVGLTHVLPVVAVVASVVTVVVWRDLSLRTEQPPVTQAESASGARQDSAAVIGPRMTTPIASGVETLVVPLGSWVHKGQLIGTGGEVNEVPGEEVQRAQEMADATQQRLDDARRQLRDLEQQLTLARTDGEAIESRMVSSEARESRREVELRRSDEMLRLGEMAEVGHDRVATARDSASEAVESAQRAEWANASSVSGLELQIADARVRVADCERRARVAAARLQRAAQPVSSNQVVAPADGILVADDPETGRFGIAADPSSLAARTQVRAADISSLRVGQTATVIAKEHPAYRFTARVSAISGEPVETAEGAVFNVELELMNPDGLKLNNAAARVQFPPAVPANQ